MIFSTPASTVGTGRNAVAGSVATSSTVYHGAHVAGEAAAAWDARDSPSRLELQDEHRCAQPVSVDQQSANGLGADGVGQVGHDGEGLAGKRHAEKVALDDLHVLVVGEADPQRARRRDRA